ncbi:MAG TPA: cobyric acid synthase [Ramlibacter sp.]|uniref:cobyric acid synthase n=1 Tax=Ramlibacter sp. TaxID=1917967 RepID=UPI002CD3BDD9|nr:cobyric acid synthase [Ramlibacter sp.]HVZ44723.1 cobyric acid synthase [Ramlibacter sp.]
MVLGTSSGAGKSFVATALCRWYARQGLKVAPFKAQNMSNNARVVAGLPASGAANSRGALGVGEIGSAQYFQALAARAEPDVRMNPVLLKPERDTASQVILMGQADARLASIPWRERGRHVWPAVSRCLDELREENDVVVIEGAGSPAEINLMASDYVNLRVARHADANCLVVADIDRGGAFAHLYGTWALLEESDRSRLRGFVLNKFRGDAALLEPGPRQLEELTGVPTVGVLPMWRGHGLPDEDAVFHERGRGPGGAARTDGLVVAIVAYPRASNLDEFQPLAHIPNVRVVWARTPAQLDDAGWVVLPGSKHTSSDLAWLRAQGLDRAVAAFAASGAPLLGVCGGLQMLGEALIDPHGIDGNGPGLGLLPLVTRFEPAKTLRRASVTFGPVRGAWSALRGIEARGYEIRHGHTTQHPGMAAGQPVLPDGLGWQDARGNVLAVYLHGLFEDARVVRALFGHEAPSLDSVFEGLADFVHRAVGASVLSGLLAHP